MTTAGSVSYAYDWLGRRVSRTVSGGTTTYVYDGGQIIAEYNGGSLIRKYIYGPGIDEPVCMVASGGIYYYHFDGLGSVAALTDSGGTLVEKYRYDAFGGTTILAPNNQTRTTSLYGNRFMFTGREWDSTTQLYYYRARDYSPTLGRFLQPDPIGYADSMNLYQYCGNNPVNFVDPWGLLRAKDHEYLTRRAMGKAGFSKNDIDTAVKANKNVDRLNNQGNNPAHYMPGSQDKAEELIKSKLESAKKSMAKGKKDEAMKELGEGLHTLQDKSPHKEDGSWGNHAKGLLPLVSSPDDNWGSGYKDTKEYLNGLTD